MCVCVCYFDRYVQGFNDLITPFAFVFLVESMIEDDEHARDSFRTYVNEHFGFNPQCMS